MCIVSLEAVEMYWVHKEISKVARCNHEIYIRKLNFKIIAL